MTNAKEGKQYNIFGRIEDMTNMEPLRGNTFAKSLHDADIFQPRDAEEAQRLDNRVHFLQGQGHFEIRPVRYAK